MESKQKKGHFTFRTAAILLMASAFVELLGMSSEVPLFGSIHNGIVSVLYHATFAGLFFVTALGLWQAARWGYTLVWVLTVVYTLDKLQLVLSRNALEAFVRLYTKGLETELLAQGITESLVIQAIVMMSGIVVLCWWGFAFYTWWRRSYFSDRVS